MTGRTFTETRDGDRKTSLLKNFIDHNLIFIPFFASEDADTFDPVFRGTEEELER